MFQKLNIVVLLIFLFNPMSALEADTIDLNEEIEGVWNVGNVSPDSSDVIASVNGLVTHGDRLRIRFVKGDCDTGNLLTTVYSHHDNPKLVDLKDQLVDGIFMGEDVVLEILFTLPLFNKQLAYVDMGWVQKDALKRILLAQKEIDLNLVDTEDFKASEYFDILQNSWPTAGLSDAIDKASMKCKSMAFSILSQRTYTFPIINMINPVEGIMIKSFSKTPSENDGVDIKVAKGTKVKAAAKGTIALISKSRVNETFVVLLRHEKNIYTVYSKLIDVNVKENDVVKAAEIIGTIGSGNPPLLHFEVRDGTKPIDPAQFLTLQKADERVLNYLMTIKGVCSKLLVNGEVLPCKNSLIQTEYQDGRIGFYFLEEGGSGKILTFSGSGLKQKKLSENVRIQPVDGVIQKDGILNVSGECYFENPYVGEANVKCVAADASGMQFEGHFLTDGSEPEIKD